MKISGKYSSAEVFASVIDDEAKKQIQELCDNEYSKGSKIRVMADCHAGAGSIVGLTMTITDKIIPGLVGSDIGCGMLCVRLNEKNIDFKKMHDFIDKNIPSGFETRFTPHEFNLKIDLNLLKCAKSINLNRARLGMLSLGSGNHFIEVAKDDDSNLYLIIHCGSRYLGSDVAKYYMGKAQREYESNFIEKNMIINDYKSKGKERELKVKLDTLKNRSIEKNRAYLQKNNYSSYFYDYLNDMDIAQEFAAINRQAIAYEIMKYMNLTEHSSFTTIHNYIDTKNMILRKGSISANEGEIVLIPINMRDGSIIAVGKGNVDYNCSAPHGAGRVLSRREAKERLNMEEYKDSMKGIWTASVCENTLDEAPSAYKKIESIIEDTKETISVLSILKPVFNYKCSKDTMFWLDKEDDCN